MGYKTRRTEHAGKLRGSDGQKEWDRKRYLKKDSAKRRRGQSRHVLRRALDDLDWWDPWCLVKTRRDEE